jgi:hypothetical protein
MEAGGAHNHPVETCCQKGGSSLFVGWPCLRNVHKRYIHRCIYIVFDQKDKADYGNTVMLYQVSIVSDRAWPIKQITVVLPDQFSLPSFFCD